MPEPQTDALKGRRILIIEDEALLAMDLRFLLEESGCEVVAEIPTLAKALEAVESLDFDAATLDLNLHGKLSQPVAAALAARGVPFVVITGYSQLMDSFDLRDAPVVGKPIDPAELLAKLNAVLS